MCTEENLAACIFRVIIHLDIMRLTSELIKRGKQQLPRSTAETCTHPLQHFLY